MKHIKHRGGSISTDEARKKVEARVLGNSGVLTSDEIEYDPKKDSELLEIGTRKDGGAQMSTKKKTRFKPQELDIGKYMSTGLVNGGVVGAVTKATKKENR